MILPNQPRRAIALILVVIVIALLTTAGLSFALLMQQSNQAAQTEADRQAAQWAAESGAAAMLGFAALPPHRRDSLGGTQHNPGLFVQSLPLQPAELTGGVGGLASLPLAGGDWSGGGDDSLGAAWDDFDPNQAATLDLTQPGFAIFDWQDSVDEGSWNGTGASGSGAIGGRSPFSGGSGLGGPAASPGFPAEAGGSSPFGQVPVVRFGWTNESSKLSLERLLQWEAAGTDPSPLLQWYCGLTPAQADRVLDWLDPDQQARAQGGEAEEYAQWGRGYFPANRMPVFLDELLLIPGIPPELLYGQRNLMSVEVPRDEAGSSADRLAELSQFQLEQIDQDLQPLPQLMEGMEPVSSWELGLWSRLTVAAKERQVDRQGQPRLAINQADLGRLHSTVTARLGPELANYLILARQYGRVDGAPTPVSEQEFVMTTEAIDLDLTLAATQLMGSLVDLIDSHVRVPQADGTVWLVASPLSAASLGNEFSVQVALAFDTLTTSDQPFTVGRIHWRLADPRLIMLIPGLTSETQALLLEAIGEGMGGPMGGGGMGGPMGGGGMADFEARSQPSGGMGGGAFLGPTAGGLGPGGMTNRGGFGSQGADSDPLAGLGGLPVQAARWYVDQQLSLDQWRVLERELTDAGDVFSAWILAHGGDFRSMQMARVMVDASAGRPRQVYYRQLLTPPPTLQAVVAALSQWTSVPNPLGTGSAEPAPLGRR